MSEEYFELKNHKPQIGQKCRIANSCSVAIGTYDGDGFTDIHSLKGGMLLEDYYLWKPFDDSREID